MAGLTVEQLKFLAAKGLSLEDAIEFAEMSGKTRSKGAERIARWRAKQREQHAGSVTERVTGNVTDNALPPPIEDHTPPVSSNEETITAPKAKREKASAPPAKPDGVKDQTWIDFLALRKRKGSPLTVTALDGIAAEAAKAGWPMESALAKCITRGWQGFEAAWVDKPPGQPAANDGSYLAHLLEKQERQALTTTPGA